MGELSSNTVAHVTAGGQNGPNQSLTMYNDFLIRLEYLKSRNPEWGDPKNQNRPFKPRFLEFIRSLVARLPVAPEIIPTQDGNVLLKFRKRHPQDTWQVMEFTITPNRRFSLVVKSRFAKKAPYTKINVARPDFLSAIIQQFYENDSLNVKEHPVAYRKAGIMDYPFIVGICQTIFGPSDEFSTKRIAKTLDYCVVADDPIYGIVSIAGLKKTSQSGDMSNYDYEIAVLYTAQSLRGLGIGGKCLRKAITDLLIDHPNTPISARIPLADGESRDICRGMLVRSGFKRTKVVRGEDKFTCFHCDVCNLDRKLCELNNQTTSVCSTVYYKLMDKGGRQGYGGRKQSKHDGS